MERTWIFAVTLVFFLTKGTSSNEGKAIHWLLVCVFIFTRLRGVILANISGSDDPHHIFHSLIWRYRRWLYIRFSQPQN